MFLICFNEFISAAVLIILSGRRWGAYSALVGLKADLHFNLYFQVDIYAQLGFFVGWSLGQQSHPAVQICAYSARCSGRLQRPCRAEAATYIGFVGCLKP